MQNINKNNNDNRYSVSSQLATGDGMVFSNNISNDTITNSKTILFVLMV